MPLAKRQLEVPLRLGGRRNVSSFLSRYANAEVAYGTIDLSGRNTPVLRARRSLDNAEADFTARQLVDGTISTWNGSGNLLTGSQTFETGWNIFEIATRTADAGVAPDGTTTADLIIPTTNNATHVVFRTVAGLDPATIHTASCYFKPSGYTWAAISESFSTGSDVHTFFNVQDGTVGTVAAQHTASIVSVGNGWFRCAVTFTTGAATTSGTLGFRITTADNTLAFAGNGTSGMLYWGAQVHGGSVLQPYVATTTSAQRAESFVTRLYNQVAPFTITSPRCFFPSGDNSKVDVPLISFTGDFFVEFTCQPVLFTNNQGVCGTATSAIILENATTIRVIHEDNSSVDIGLSITLVALTQYTIRVSRTSGVYTATIDGVNRTVGTPTSSQTFNVSAIGVGRGRLFNGILHSVTINGVRFYQGFGNDNAAWVDTLGGQNGTVTGTPQLAYFDSSRNLWVPQMHLLQPTANLQPRIMYAGAVITTSNQPAIEFPRTAVNSNEVRMRQLDGSFYDFVRLRQHTSVGVAKLNQRNGSWQGLLMPHGTDSGTKNGTLGIQFLAASTGNFGSHDTNRTDIRIGDVTMSNELAPFIAVFRRNNAGSNGNGASYTGRLRTSTQDLTNTETQTWSVDTATSTTNTGGLTLGKQWDSNSTSAVSTFRGTMQVIMWFSRDIETQTDQLMTELNQVFGVWA